MNSDYYSRCSEISLLGMIGYTKLHRADATSRKDAAESRKELKRRGRTEKWIRETVEKRVERARWEARHGDRYEDFGQLTI